MREPDYSITVNGLNITPEVSGRLISLSLTDKRAFEADDLTLVLDDTDGGLAIPPSGAKIRVALGWKDTGLTDKGEYVVDEMTHDGPPDRLTIRARSANFHASLNEQKRRSFDNVPLGDVLRTIAEAHDLQLAITEALGWRNVGHVDQTDESDGHLLTRLGRRFDCVATVKDGRLLFMPLGQGQTVSGGAMTSHTINRQAGDRHSFSRPRGQTDFTGVRANWHDLDAAETKQVTVQDDTDQPKLKTLSATFNNEAEARDAAQAEWNKIKRGRFTMELDLAEGMAELLPESSIHLVGWKEEIVGQSWIAEEVSHALNESGYTTRVALATTTT